MMPNAPAAETRVKELPGCSLFGTGNLHRRTFARWQFDFAVSAHGRLEPLPIAPLRHPASESVENVVADQVGVAGFREYAGTHAFAIGPRDTGTQPVDGFLVPMPAEGAVESLVGQAVHRAGGGYFSRTVFLVLRMLRSRP